MNRYFGSMSFAVLICAAASIQAATVTASTSAYMSFRNCTTSGLTICDGISNPPTVSIGGLPGDLAASAALAGFATRMVTGSAQILPQGSALLSAASTSLPGSATLAPTRDSSNSYSLQYFSYTGTTAATLVFSADLAFDQLVPLENASFAQNGATRSGITAIIEVFRANPVLEAGATQLENFSFLLGGFRTDSSYVPLASDGFSSPGVTASGSSVIQVAVDMNPGEGVWLYSALQAPSVNGAVIVGTLTSSISAVPEPGTWLLATLGVAGLLGELRRRHHSVS